MFQRECQVVWFNHYMLCMYQMITVSHKSTQLKHNNDQNNPQGHSMGTVAVPILQMGNLGKQTAPNFPA